MFFLDHILNGHLWPTIVHLARGSALAPALPPAVTPFGDHPATPTADEPVSQVRVPHKSVPSHIRRTFSLLAALYTQQHCPPSRHPMLVDVAVHYNRQHFFTNARS